MLTLPDKILTFIVFIYDSVIRITFVMRSNKQTKSTHIITFQNNVQRIYNINAFLIKS